MPIQLTGNLPRQLQGGKSSRKKPEKKQLDGVTTVIKRKKP